MENRITTPLAPPIPPRRTTRLQRFQDMIGDTWLDLRTANILPWLLVLAVIGVLVAGIVARDTAQSQAATPVAPVMRPSTPPAPTSAPTLEVNRSANELPRAVVAYWEPNGAAYPDPLVEGAAYRVVGRWGVEWLQIEFGGAQPLWVRAEGITVENLASIPDLQPTATPVVVERIVEVQVAPAAPPVAPVAPATAVMPQEARDFAEYTAAEPDWTKRVPTPHSDQSIPAEGMPACEYYALHPEKYTDQIKMYYQCP